MKHAARCPQGTRASDELVQVWVPREQRCALQSRLLPVSIPLRGVHFLLGSWNQLLWTHQASRDPQTKHLLTKLPTFKYAQPAIQVEENTHLG